MEDFKRRFDEFCASDKDGKKSQMKAPTDKNHPMKQFDSELWRIEIDLENVNDLVKRIENDRKPTMRETLKSYLPSIF